MGPSPHYPNWRYTCPECLQAWESANRYASAFTVCPRCFHGGKA